MAGGVVVLAAFIFAYNVIMTFVRSRHPHEEMEHEPVEARTERSPSAFMRRSQETINVPVITIGGMVVFTIMTFMVVAMPYMFTPDEPSARAHELSYEEKSGESVYKANGCFYCHNQFIRPQDWAMGVTSANGDFYYSIPNFLGTERTGPSLGQIGGKRPTEWHIQHDEDPRSVSPSSIMPPFAFLSADELDALVTYIQNLGSENLNPNGFQPPIPVEYQGKTNPYLPTMTEVTQYYDSENQTFSGSDTMAADWATLFDEGKMLFIQKCLSCHGCSGNAQGPYARQVVTRPANLHERLINYPEPQETFHFWRVSAGVPGSAMPPWHLSLDETTIWKIATYELSFANGALRTVDGEVSDDEGDKFNDETGIKPPIAGTRAQFEMGQQLYGLYCAQCHGVDGHGDGPASILTPGGYITPEPANFEESGTDFTNYGRWVWKVREGVETTNMPPWKYVLSDDEIFRLIFYIQGFSLPEDYNSKWALLYTDDFAKSLKE
jgi:cytochrome c oxidase cbb3-type subunit I/II